MSQELCPICNNPMVERKGKYGSFLGCSTFPKCKGTRQIVKSNGNGKTAVAQHKELKLIATPSKYQKAIFDDGMELLKNGQTSDGCKNLIVKATAGSGKTATTEHFIVMVKNEKPDAKMIYLVFNKRVEIEATEKGLPAQTTHSKYLNDYKNWRGSKVQIDNNKIRNIVRDLLELTIEEEGWMISPVCQIVSKVKNTCAPTDEVTLNKICEKFSIEVNGSSDRIFELVRTSLKINNEQLDVVDFDDMLYLTWRHKVPVEKYDWVFVDEAQDFNRVQIELILRTVSDNGHVVVVGDSNQAIYSFRGADTRAMENLKDALDAKEMPLSISYRNPKSHVNLINSIFPEIQHEAWENAKEGNIGTMSCDWMLGQVKDGDLVICRTNAPLIKPVFALIRQGVKAIILGRDIGDNLISLVERFKTKNADDLLDKLYEYQVKEIAKLLKQEKTNQAQSLQDKVETISAIAEDCKYTWEVTKKIEEIFSDKKEGVVFSTVHKAKGSEAKRVFILEPSLMPHPMAKGIEGLEQEKHILFVALSRSKDEMYFVNGPVPAGLMNEKLYEDAEETKEEKETEETIEQETIEEVEQESEVPMLKFAQKKQVPVCPF